MEEPVLSDAALTWTVQARSWGAGWVPRAAPSGNPTGWRAECRQGHDLGTALGAEDDGPGVSGARLRQFQHGVNVSPAGRTSL